MLPSLLLASSASVSPPLFSFAAVDDDELSSLPNAASSALEVGRAVEGQHSS